MAKKILLVLWVVSVLVISHANIKTMKKILACLLLCLMMTGCEYDNTIKGWCVGKEHKPAYSIDSIAPHVESFIPKRGTYGLLTALLFAIYVYQSKRITTSAKANM